MTQIVLKRVYDEALPTDGYRILIDRLWPRGVSKAAAAVDEWNKNLAPTTELRKWYNHEPEKWKIFCEKYVEELKANDVANAFWETYKKQEKITFVYAAKEEKYSQALVLKSLFIIA